MVSTPEEYVNGFTFFLGHKIDLSKRPLIPRPETAFWVAQAINEIENSKEHLKCLDIFSGSGCVGLAVLLQAKNTNVDFIDIEDNFLEQIKINIESNQIHSNRYNIFKSNIFSSVNEKYDYILANPPYVAKDRINEVGKDVLFHEPSIALFSGPKGMDIINVFLREAINYLEQKGIIYLEFDQEQKEEIIKILEEVKYSHWTFHKDQFDVIRFVRINK